MFLHKVPTVKFWLKIGRSSQTYLSIKIFNFDVEFGSMKKNYQTFCKPLIGTTFFKFLKQKLHFKNTFVNFYEIIFIN